MAEVLPVGNYDDRVIALRAEAARQVLATLGIKQPSYWEVRTVGDALAAAERRGAEAEREAPAYLPTLDLLRGRATREGQHTLAYWIKCAADVAKNLARARGGEGEGE